MAGLPAPPPRRSHEERLEPGRARPQPRRAAPASARPRQRGGPAWESGSCRACMGRYLAAARARCDGHHRGARHDRRVQGHLPQQTWGVGDMRTLSLGCIFNAILAKQLLSSLRFLLSRSELHVAWARHYDRLCQSSAECATAVRELVPPLKRRAITCSVLSPRSVSSKGALTLAAVFLTRPLRLRCCISALADSRGM